ncbi:SDR family oxidoreductase [Flaviaesturariibacter amylovorans]|uniref:SDR family oxidoreductase n=1 Tax=Flaviaesturariibacter amylovorans TaxID=1084520 RepID=A0ABP8HNZ7_9BACT
MQTTNNTVLITGGSSGIGLALAAALLEAGNGVLICGRDEGRLAEAKRQLPRVHTRVCDVSNKAGREALADWATGSYPAINMLVNNAGIQRELDFLAGAADFNDSESEIETNLTAGIHLSALFLPHFLRQERECAIVNVTSGLAFIPLKIVPVYCATKAALHSFSMSLRSQLAGTNTRVFEIAPPIVKTGLHREAKARRQAERGIAPEVVARETLKALAKDRYQCIVGQAKSLKGAARIAPLFFHRLLNKLATR